LNCSAGGGKAGFGESRGFARRQELPPVRAKVADHDVALHGRRMETFLT
jgi:hypothetical protein